MYIRDKIALHIYTINTVKLGKPSYEKNGKKTDNVRFGRPPPPPNGKKWKKTRKLRQMRFRDKTAYVWGLGYRWDP